MLIRTLSIIAIIAGLGTAGVAYYERTVQIPSLMQQRDAQKQEKNREIAAHDRTKAELAKTSTDLRHERQDLANVKVEQQMVAARTDAQEKRADKLQGQLASATSDLDNTREFLNRYKATGVTPAEADTLNYDLAAAQKQRAELAAQLRETNREYVAARQRLGLYVFEPENPEPFSLKGNVTQVDPKWSFAVINIGQSQGVRPDAQLLVSRQGKLVCKVVVRGIQKDQCIVDVLPQWKFGDIMEGDLVTPANPASSLGMDSDIPKIQP